MQFLGTEEVFALQEISDSINIIGPNVAAEANNIIFWMGNDKFFAYDGRVSTLPCTLKQYVFEDMNKTNGRLNLLVLIVSLMRLYGSTVQQHQIQLIDMLSLIMKKKYGTTAH